MIFYLLWVVVDVNTRERDSRYRADEETLVNQNLETLFTSIFIIALVFVYLSLL